MPFRKRMGESAPGALAPGGLAVSVRRDTHMHSARHVPPLPLRRHLIAKGRLEERPLRLPLIRPLLSLLFSAMHLEWPDCREAATGRMRILGE
jgi:hypothetical protein